MKNINKNLIFGLGIALVILVILALGMITLPRQTHAYAGYVTPYNTPSLNGGNEYNSYHAPSYPAPVTPVYQTQPVVYKTQPVVYQTQPVYQNNYSNAPQASTTDTEVSNKTTSTGVNAYSDLAASSLFGRYSFMPSGLMQWILLAIFILVIVILVRKVTGVGEDYHNSPLKHA